MEFQVSFSTSMLFVFPKPIFIRQDRCYLLRLCSNLLTVCKVYLKYAAVNQLLTAKTITRLMQRMAEKQLRISVRVPKGLMSKLQLHQPILRENKI